MYRLQITLLGQFEIQIDSELIHKFDSDKVRGLLAYLATHANEHHSRTKLATLLWSDYSEQVALVNLRNTLARLRKTLDVALYPNGGKAEQRPMFLSATRQHVGLILDPEIDFVDVHLFDALMAEAIQPHGPEKHCASAAQKLTRAFALYQGEFLSSFVIDEIEYQDWVRYQADKRHAMAVNGMAWLTQYHLREGDYLSADAWIQRHLALLPWSETAYRHKMVCLAAQGEYAAAQHVYAKLETVLQDELSVLPSPQSEALGRLIQQQATLLEMMALVMPEQSNTYTVSAHSASQDMSAPTSGLPALNIPSQTLPEIGAVRASLSNNLPVVFDALIDRVAETDKLRRQILENHQRIVTLTGLGGVGKTQLAISFAWEMLPHFRDGIWFISLADVTGDPMPELERVQLLDAVAQALRLPPIDSSSQSLIEQTLGILSSREMLLVLDNVEHLHTIAEFAMSVVTHCPQIVLLLTSRHHLPLAEGYTLHLTGLTVPPLGADLTTIKENDAVRLFYARAERHTGYFVIDETNADDIVAICREIDGLPLAVKLAADLTRYATCRQILAQLRATGDLVASQFEIHAPAYNDTSMKNVFDYSWRLLSPRLQEICSSCALFVSHFNTEAAKAVAGATLAELIGLCDRSLLERQGDGRFSMHPLLRQYALHQMGQVQVAEAGERYTHYLLTLLINRGKDLTTDAVAMGMDVIGEQLSDFTAAWIRGVQCANVDLLLAALTPLWRYFELSRRWEEGVHLFAQTVAKLKKDSSNQRHFLLMGTACVAWGSLLFLLNQGERALEVLNTAVDAAEELQDDFLLASAHLWLARLHHRESRISEGYADCRRALSAAQACNAHDLIAAVHLVESDLLNDMGVFNEAQQLVRLSLRIYEDQRDIARVVEGTVRLSNIYSNMGEFGAAQKALQSGLELSKQHGLRMNQDRLYLMAGHYGIYNGTYFQALAHFQSVQFSAAHFVDAASSAESLFGQAVANLYLGRYIDARQKANHARQIAQDGLIRYWHAKSLSALAATEYFDGDFLQAYLYSQEMLDYCEANELPSLRAEALCLASYTLAAMGRLTSAETAVREFHRRVESMVKSKLENHFAWGEIQSIHTQICLDSGRIDKAQTHAELLWGYLQKRPYGNSAVSPYQLYWNAYQGFSVAGNPNAVEVVAQAQALLNHHILQLSRDGSVGGEEERAIILHDYIEHNRWRRQLSRVIAKELR